MLPPITNPSGLAEPPKPPMLGTGVRTPQYQANPFTFDPNQPPRRLGSYASQGNLGIQPEVHSQRLSNQYDRPIQSQ